MLKNIPIDSDIFVLTDSAEQWMAWVPLSTERYIGRLWGYLYNKGIAGRKNEEIIAYIEYLIALTDVENLKDIDMDGLDPVAAELVEKMLLQ